RSRSWRRRSRTPARRSARGWTKGSRSVCRNSTGSRPPRTRRRALRRRRASTAVRTRRNGSVKTYEAMLLVEPTVAAKEWTRVGEEIDRIVKRNGGAVLQVVRFGERKLAFPVKKNNRGTYVLAYFSAPEKVLGKV